MSPETKKEFETNWIEPIEQIKKSLRTAELSAYGAMEGEGLPEFSIYETAFTKCAEAADKLDECIKEIRELMK